jgi:hypothetical protein
VGLTAKWALVLKLRPFKFKANKHLSPVSKISASEALIYTVGPKWP